MVEDAALLEFMRAISAGTLVARSPALAGAQLTRGGTRANAPDFFLPELRLQLYAGDTALHVAAAAYNLPLATSLVAAGADIRARNRRGAEPLHAATIGNPVADTWNPQRQAAMITFLVGVGADPNSPAAGGVTPLHRAVRNRCSAAVRALLNAGADPSLANNNGSTPAALAEWTTGRGGSGSPEAKAEQAAIVTMLAAHA